MEETVALPVVEPSQIGDARRRAVELSRHLGFDETEAGKVALVVTEAATNLVKHARGGELIARVLSAGRTLGLEILALDKGPGMDAALALRDGYSTAGSSGTGLGAIARLSTVFDLYSLPGKGTALVAELWPGPVPAGMPSPPKIGGVGVTKPGEEVSGDAWGVSQSEDCTSILMADGLGHGVGAAEAAREAILAFQEDPDATPTLTLERVHDALKKTRGAAVALAKIDLTREIVCYAGIGNISATIIADGGQGRVSHLVSHNGTAGHEVRKIQEFTYPWTNDSVLIMHSDGLVTHWDLDHYPGLLARRPSLIAGVLYRDFTRQRDDVTVVVAKQT